MTIWSRVKNAFRPDRWSDTELESDGWMMELLATDEVASIFQSFKSRLGEPVCAEKEALDWLVGDCRESLSQLAAEISLSGLTDILDQWIVELMALRAKPSSNYGHLIVQWPHDQDFCSLYLGEDGFLALLSATLAQKVKVENISDVPGWGRSLTSEKLLVGLLESYVALYCNSFQLQAERGSRAAGLG